MKKFYTVKSLAVVAFALMANVAFGQNLKITADGNPVANGDVLDVPYEVEDLSYPEYNYFNYTYTWNPHLQAATEAGTAELTVTVTSVNNTAGFQICWPSSCHQVNSGAEVKVTGDIKTTPVDLQIDKVTTIEEMDKEPENKLPTEGGTVKVKFECGSETMEITVNAVLADKNGVGANIADADSPTQYYTIQGVRVAEPQKGQLYIERKGGKVTKKVF
ncbi:MAG: hypothetical protein K2I92_05220 [Muribaculaceae bacterium]|nr:hypothetical protein [Muribaculaceae bacterium]